MLFKKHFNQSAKINLLEIENVVKILLKIWLTLQNYKSNSIVVFIEQCKR